MNWASRDSTVSCCLPGEAAHEGEGVTMRVPRSVRIVLLSLTCTVPAFAREVLVCNYVLSPVAQTKPYEITPGTMLRCKDKTLKDIPNSLAGLYNQGYHLVSVVSFDTEYEGKKTTVLQYYFER